MNAIRWLAATIALSAASCILFVNFDDPAATSPNCAVAKDCPGEDTPCRKIACVAGRCTANDLAAETSVPDADAGNCLGLACASGGQVKVIGDNTDVLATGNPCTNFTCQDGKPVLANANAQTPCGNQGKLHCDGNGKCAGCMDPTDCPPPTLCSSFTCDKTVCNQVKTPDGQVCGQPGMCVDGTTLQSPDTCASGGCQAGTKMTCGKGEACVNAACLTMGSTNGQACNVDGDCMDMHCVAGICCDTGCNVACQACTAKGKKDGSADGHCGPAIDGAICSKSCNAGMETDNVCLAGSCTTGDAFKCPTGSCGMNGECLSCTMVGCGAGFKCENGSCCSGCGHYSSNPGNSAPLCAKSKLLFDAYQNCVCVQNCSNPCAMRCSGGAQTAGCTTCLLTCGVPGLACSTD